MFADVLVILIFLILYFLLRILPAISVLQRRIQKRNQRTRRDLLMKRREIGWGTTKMTME